MPAIHFRGAILRHFDVRRDEGGVFCRAHFTADYSAPVISAMGWEELPDGITSAKLEGRLDCQNFILTPNGKELAKDYEIDLPASEASDFQFFRVQGDDGESTSMELRFIIRTTAQEAEMWLGKYMRSIGEGRGALKINHTKQEELFDEQSEPSKKTQREAAARKSSQLELTQ